MKRRHFLQLLTAGGAISISPVFSPGKQEDEHISNREVKELEKHTISDISFTDVELHYPRQVGKNAQLDIHGMGPTIKVGILHTDKGAMGWGMLQGGSEEEAAEYLRDKRITEVFKPSEGIIDQQIDPFDLSLHDLSGNILDKPVYELLGRTTPITTNCYSGMIYFDDLEPNDDPAGIDKIMEECQYDYDYGYRQFKLKIGRGNKWMEPEEGMKQDIEVTQMVADHFPDCDILVDANNGYSLDDTITYLEGIEDIDLFWFEEPFHENKDDYLALRKWLLNQGKKVFLADGEAHPDQELLANLYEQRILDVHLTDIVGYGFTPWRQLMPQLIEMGISASPHAWGSLFKTYYNAHLAGAWANTPTIEGVTCDSDDVDFGDYQLKDGTLIPSSAPGFGMKLLKDYS
jgi:L-alanine-DL-glutamate epimerase-like enolase superfamily enzyme